MAPQPPIGYRTPTDDDMKRLPLGSLSFNEIDEKWEKSRMIGSTLDYPIKPESYAVPLSADSQPPSYPYHYPEPPEGYRNITEAEARRLPDKAIHYNRTIKKWEAAITEGCWIGSFRDYALPL